MTSTLKMIDLFAGTGAFTYAFEETKRVECVYANDMSEASKAIYDLNFNHKLDKRDLMSVPVQDIPAHDILTGGFPCQPFRIAGKQEGFDDKRSNVFWKIMEIVDAFSPACVVLENVKNLVTHDNKKTFQVITDNLKSRGYHLKFKVLNTCDITGIPQNRERIYLVALKSESIHRAFSLDFPPIDTMPITSCFEPSQVPEKYYYTDKKNNLVHVE